MLTHSPSPAAAFNAALPDPIRHAEFYDGVPTKRALAWIIDMVLIMVVTALIVPFTAFTALFFLPLLYASVSFVYRTATLTNHSATWGMRLMSVRMLDHSGRAFNLPTAALHTLGTTLSFAFVLPQVISILLMLTTARGQGLTDHILGTVAINKPARA